jgi:hypothetical protein
MRLNHDGYILLIVLLVNLLIAVCYLLFCQIRKNRNRRSSVLRFIVMLLAPVCGILFFFFGWLYFRIFFHRKVDLAEVIFSKRRVKTAVKADESAERNLVPLEEAIAVTDKMNTRSLMMEVVRKDISHSLSTIALALESEDSEVAHYGASVLQSALADFRGEVEKLLNLIRDGEREFADSPAQMPEADIAALAENERTLIGDLNAVLCQHVLTPMEQEYYVGRMSETAEFLRSHSKVNAQEMEMLCVRLLENGDTAHASVWAERSAEEWPEALSSYTNRLRLYYQTGDRERFADEMKELKKSGVPADHKTLEAIRLFTPVKSSE